MPRRTRKAPKTRWLPPTCECGKGKVTLSVVIRMRTKVGVVEVPAKDIETGDPKKACEACFRIWTITRPKDGPNPPEDDDE